MGSLRRSQAGGFMDVTNTVVVLAAALVGCGAPVTGPTKLTQWQGSAPHFIAQGLYDNETIDLSIMGDAAKDVAKLYCRREYVVPLNAANEKDYAQGRQDEVQIDAPVTVNGQERYFEIELKKHNLQKDPAGTAVTIINRDPAMKPAAGQMWLEWEWHLPDATTLYEKAAHDGTFTLGEFTGTPDSSGLVIPENTGTVGGFFTASWGGAEEVSVSFTAKCTTNAVTQ